MTDDEVLQGEIVTDQQRTGPRPHPVTKEERRERLREYALFAPRLVRLVYRLMKDPRVPARTKAMLVVVAGYIVSPIDVIPDFIPGVGRFDDLLVAAFALDQILNRVPEHVVIDHWDGDEDVLRIIKEILDISTGFMPASIRKRFVK
ncbi:MAG: YkvA family protein [Actinomycetota bacterium]